MVNSRFLHAADLHLGAPLQSLGDSVPADVAAGIRQRVNRVFDNLVQVAIREQVAFVVLAGDVYDTAERDPGARRRVMLGLRQLDDAGIPVFMVHGNHDPLTSQFVAGAALPPNVTVFGAGGVESRVVTMPNGVPVTVAGISYATAAETNNLSEQFSGVVGSTVVGVLHTNVGGNSQHGNYAPCSAADLETSPVHYWALGHVHDRQVHATPKGFWAYPGNLQGRSAKATECGAKGVLLVDVHADGGLGQPLFQACDVVRFQRLAVDLSQVGELDSVHDHVIASLQQAVDAAEDRSLMVRLSLCGATGINAELGKNWQSVRAAIVEEAADVLTDGGVVKVINSCRPAIDLVAERAKDTLLGSVLNELDLLEQPDLDPALRLEVERLLVDALDGAR
ncbi:unannotated protein [freshwater metagenome]|uniref:Unannotated protein n=1 Tax=freshwater metagenome TaxID=449393 RepID=A0A6J7F3K1_9ZZZZ|nr:DNA repair exonuclease [Actinomycetota bacterium]